MNLMMKSTDELTDEAFGVIPVYRKPDQVLFLLIQHNAGHWAFPKGHADEIETALRELAEEAGITEVELDTRKVFQERYTKTWRGNARRIVTKTVRYYIGAVSSQRVNVQEAEIQAHRWATADEARKLITYSESRKLLEEAVKYLSAV
jgi:bis(5'-nucleosidyl)-tetraphosphatase